MEINILSYTFVGAWRSPMTQIPMLDRRFCLELFGDTINTTAGLAQEGFVIRKQIGQPPYKTVIINPQRLQITTMNPIETAQVYLKVIEEINRISGGTIPLFFSGIGLNTEQEIFGFSDETSKGLTDRFIIEGINADENGKKPIARTLNITIEWTIGDDNKLNIVLQPRIGIPN
ncbi:MAG: hypothetical protein K8R21_10920, partial [Leptospira sp.]|nr:hypothetical protein [Leptospira sp.]